MNVSVEITDPPTSTTQAVVNEINVTPLVDVMLVLLIIFMVTTPMMQQGIDIDLPETASSGIPVVEEPFILKIAANGRISVGDTIIPMKDLKKKLEAIYKVRKEKHIYIQADRSVNYGVVAEALAEVKMAGIHGIGLVTLPRSSP